jgi:AcrR family transcriptional regulator
MPRKKTITDEEILSVARSLFLKEGAKASTRTLAKIVGISESVIFQRFNTKPVETERAISDAIEALWKGLAP